MLCIKHLLLVKLLFLLILSILLQILWLQSRLLSITIIWHLNLLL